MSKFHLPEDYLKPGQTVKNERGEEWEVLRYVPAPSITIKNLQTGTIMHGTVDSPIFSDFGFQIPDLDS